ncbi:MAG TPA: RsmB/NOP family class I SAM-dependent RNA methyltransferase [Candidatus Lokiarchaeia archaeon]|nr:RsmB/NOP family class I SAM-dependent RNA methyltransferase [Candidatus Lokiarchaeia archaeon]
MSRELAAQRVVEEFVKYLGENPQAIKSPVDLAGTRVKYLIAQLVKYQNLLNFFYVKNDLRPPPRRPKTDPRFKALAFLAFYFVAIEKKKPAWVERQLLGGKWGFPTGTIARGAYRVSEASLPDLLADLPLAEQLSIQYAHPLFFVEKMMGLLPRSEVPRLLQANNVQRSLYLRTVNPDTEPQDVSSGFRRIGVPTRQIPDLPFVFRVERRHLKQVVLSPFYQEGAVIFHDIASIRACVVLNPHQGELILDACAAPLMKTQLLQFLCNGEATILSTEVSLLRLQQSPNFPWFKSSLMRLNADVISLPVRLQRDEPLFDKILLDAPCTSSGAIYYNPADKWRQTPAYLAQHVRLQTNLIRECAQHLKVGGKLVYCVCSCYLEEGEGIISTISEQTVLRSSHRFFPHTDKCQGFFIAELEKKSA